MRSALSAFVLLSMFAAVSAFAAPGEGKTCYVRQYSDSHLARNPGQTARAILVTLGISEYGNFTHMIQARHKDHSQDLYGGGGGCWRRNGKVTCGLDMDSGSFTVERSGDKLLLRVVGHIRLFNEEDMAEEELPEDEWSLEEGRDNGIFLLKRVPVSQCRI